MTTKERQKLIDDALSGLHCRSTWCMRFGREVIAGSIPAKVLPKSRTKGARKFYKYSQTVANPTLREPLPYHYVPRPPLIMTEDDRLLEEIHRDDDLPWWEQK